MILNGGYQWLCDKISSSKVFMNRCASCWMLLFHFFIFCLILGFAPFSSKSLTTSIVLLMNSFCFCISSWCGPFNSIKLSSKWCFFAPGSPSIVLPAPLIDFLGSRFEGEAALKNSSLFFFSSNSCLFCCMISFNSGDKVDENASARAEAMAFVWSPLACIGGWSSGSVTVKFSSWFSEGVNLLQP